MSERNGDKARFGRERKRKILRRKGNRELRRALESKMPKPAVPSPSENDLGVGRAGTFIKEGPFETANHLMVVR